MAVCSHGPLHEGLWLRSFRDLKMFIRKEFEVSFENFHKLVSNISLTVSMDYVMNFLFVWLCRNRTIDCFEENIHIFIIRCILTMIGGHSMFSLIDVIVLSFILFHIKFKSSNLRLFFIIRFAQYVHLLVGKPFCSHCGS